MYGVYNSQLIRYSRACVQYSDFMDRALSCWGKSCSNKATLLLGWSRRYKDFYRTWLYIWATRRVSYKKKEHLTLIEHLSSPPVFGRVRVAHLSSALCCPIMCLYVLSSVLWCPLRFPSLPPVVCRMAHILSTLFVLCFCFVFLRLVYPMSPVSLDCPFFLALSVFSNVYSMAPHVSGMLPFIS